MVMPRVTHVKSARKANPKYDIEVGDSYYHWSFMVGGRGGPKICSKTPPTRSQLTRSEFLGSAYDIAENSLPGCEDADGLRSVAQEIRDLGQEQSDKFDNMPDGLQQGDTGQMLEERAQQCEEWADAIDSAADDLESAIGEIESKTLDDFDDLDEDATPEEIENARQAELEAALSDAVDEAGSSCPF